MADRTTKLLLLAIAVGLWANIASQWSPVQAQDRQMRQILSAVQDIERAVGRIQRGTCINGTIC